MNAITPILTSEADRWNGAQRRADEWRGSVIQCFAQAETAVSETLLVLHAIPRSSGKVRLQHLTGQRFQDLADAIAVDGPFADIGKPARMPLAIFREYHEMWRPFLCHGTGKIALDRQRRWLLVLNLLVFQSAKPDRRTKVMVQADAGPLLEEIQSAGQKLACALGTIRKAGTN